MFNGKHTLEEVEFPCSELQMHRMQLKKNLGGGGHYVFTSSITLHQLAHQLKGSPSLSLSFSVCMQAVWGRGRTELLCDC